MRSITNGRLLCTNANSARHPPAGGGRLMSTSETWVVNGHTTQCTSPRIRGLSPDHEAYGGIYDL